MISALHNNTITTIRRAYDILMIFSIALGVIPLMFREQSLLFDCFELIACSLFIIDYLLRWVLYCKSREYRVVAIIKYPFTAWAIFDLLTILPVFNVLGRAFITLRIVRVFALLRIFKTLRYSKEIKLLLVVLKKEAKILLAVLYLAIFYIFTTALLMFNFEDSFVSFFDALYWATTALTTVGYGDVCPVTDLGRFISMVSSLFGVAIIALPSGIITAGYMSEIKQGQPNDL